MSIRTAPIRFKFSWSGEWQIFVSVEASDLQELAEYDGAYRTLPICLSHVLRRHLEEHICVYIGGNVDISVFWDWRLHPTVSFEKIEGYEYHDIGSGLEIEGVHAGTDEYQSVIDNLQEMIDARRTAEGLPVGGDNK